MFALLLASISVFNSCKPKDPDDEQNLDDNENEEEIVEDEIVSPDYVPIDWENASIISSNDSIGDYSINFTGEVPSIVPGSVITIDQDSIIRYVFVEDVQIDGNTISMTTSEAYLTDIFANTTITLTSDNNKRGSNVFLPTEIFYYDDNGEKCIIDLNSTRDDNFGFTHNIWNYGMDLDELELVSGDNFKIWMEKMNFNFDLDFDMEMNFGGRNVVEIMANGLERYKSKAMNIETSLVGDFDIEQKIRFDADGNCSYSPGYDLWKHNFFKPMTIRFSVYGVPVIIVLRADLFREVELSAEGDMSSYVGFSDYADGKLGFNWAQSGSITPIKQFSNTFEFTPPTIEGKGKIEAKAWVFPRISMMLYSVIGPSFDLKPYLSTTLSGGFKEEMLGTDNDFCAWSLDCNTGLDAACGLSLGFMGYETENYSTDDFNIVDKTLYHSPQRIELVPMQKKIRVKEGKEVRFNVYDRNHLANCDVLTPLPQFVKFEGDGEFSEEYGIADGGEVSVEWTPSSEDDVMYARLYDYEGKVISESEFTIETNVITSSVTDITTESAKCGGEVRCYYDDDIYERGICWSTSSQPDVNDQCATSGVGSGSFTCEMTGLEDNTTYYVRAYAKMYDYVVYGEQRSFKTEEDDEICDPDGYIAGHGYVDLGLPSGLKWATCNVGASSPEDYGDYFAWGETSPKAEYTLENSVTYGEQMSDISGNAQYDAATANWGGSWRMPTKEQMEELVEHCEWEWTQVNGVNGAKVIGPNGSCIFLPAAGDRGGSSLYDAGTVGYYWSSTPLDNNNDYRAYYLRFSYGYEYVYYIRRYFGQSVRPITE